MPISPQCAKRSPSELFGHDRTPSAEKRPVPHGVKVRTRRGPALLRRGFASPKECTDHAPAVVNALADTLGHRLIALIDQEFAVSKDGMADTHGRKSMPCCCGRLIASGSG